MPRLVLCSPDGNDVGEQEEEADDLQVPAASEVLKGNHNQRHHHQGAEEDLGEAVHLEVKQADLGDKPQSRAGGRRRDPRPPRRTGPPLEKPPPRVRHWDPSIPVPLVENAGLPGLELLTDIQRASKHPDFKFFF